MYTRYRHELMATVRTTKYKLYTAADYNIIIVYVIVK